MNHPSTHCQNSGAFIFAAETNFRDKEFKGDFICYIVSEIAVHGQLVALFLEWGEGGGTSLCKV